MMNYLASQRADTLPARSRRWRTGAMLFVVAAACGAVVLRAARAAPPAAAAPSVVQIEITKFKFVPSEVTVAPGTKVVWINRDETPHTVSTPDKQFVSSALDTNDSFERSFTSAGDVSYFCTLHPFMTGVVHVSAK